MRLFLNEISPKKHQVEIVYGEEMMKRLYIVIIVVLVFSACTQSSLQKKEIEEQKPLSTITQTSIILLGTVQDGGSPHAGCKKDCCKNLFQNPDPTRKVVSLGIIDPENKKSFLFEATPDLPTQMKQLKNLSSFAEKETPDGIFLTHAHIGHYAGLMFLGKEAMSAKETPVYAMPRMKVFLEQNGPWQQLVTLNNISLQPLQDSVTVQLTPNITVMPFTVPHRDEYSETVGYTIKGTNKTALFIPDIDKWEKWDTDVITAIAKVDYAFIDATFYDGEELNNRDISQIPHPFVVESMEKFKHLSAAEKDKIYFIHFNHTNPLLNLQSEQAKKVLANGFHIAEYGMVLGL